MLNLMVKQPDAVDVTPSDWFNYSSRKHITTVIIGYADISRPNIIAASPALAVIFPTDVVGGRAFRRYPTPIFPLSNINRRYSLDHAGPVEELNLTRNPSRDYFNCSSPVGVEALTAQPDSGAVWEHGYGGRSHTTNRGMDGFSLESLTACIREHNKGSALRKDQQAFRYLEEPSDLPPSRIWVNLFPIKDSPPPSRHSGV